MRYWRVERRQAEGQLDFGRTLELMAAIGHADVNAVAGAILKTVSTVAPIAQCTIFAYEFGNRPRTVAVADRRGGRFLQDIAESYARHYYALDGNQRVIAPAPGRKMDPAIVLHQQASDEIDHPGYRAACYQKPNVSDRLSLLVQPAVLRCVLEGLTAVEIAEIMGVQPSSVTTYQKRAYKRLGISSQRQLFALCMAPAP